MPFSAGYGPLSHPANRQRIQPAPTDVPPLDHWPFIPMRSDASSLPRLPRSTQVCCGHAALVHATGASLAELGVPPAHSEQGMDFASLQRQLDDGARVLGRTDSSFRLLRTALSVSEMLAPHVGGIYVALVYHMHSGDIDDVDPARIRDAFHTIGVEPIPHYVVVNKDAKIVVVYPEVCPCILETVSSYHDAVCTHALSPSCSGAGYEAGGGAGPCIANGSAGEGTLPGILRHTTGHVCAEHQAALPARRSLRTEDSVQHAGCPLPPPWRRCA